MNITNTPIHRRLRLRLALPLLIGATVLLGACGSDDGEATDTNAAVETAATIATIDDGSIDVASGIEPAAACGLFDLAAVDAALGTTGVTTSIDTSLGLYNGCRWATAATDVPALLVGYDPTGDFGHVRELACDGTTAEPVIAAGADAVACFGAVIAPAGSGVILVSIEDPLDQWDDATEIDVAARFAVVQ